MVMQIDSPGIAVARTFLSGSNFACDGSTDSSSRQTTEKMPT